MDSYRLKTVKYQNTQRKILLQNENGPCPLLAATNALLLRGVISLPQSCVRSMTATTNDVVNVLAERALKRCRDEDFAAQHATEWKTVGKAKAASAEVAEKVDDGRSDVEVSSADANMQSHLNDLMFLFPSLQYGLDVNPRFSGGPAGVEYTKNVAVFDLLGVELVHGWLLDPQDVDTAELVGRKTYNELIEMVIRGKDAASELEKVEQSINRKTTKLNRLRNPKLYEVPEEVVNTKASPDVNQPADLELQNNVASNELARAEAAKEEDWVQVEGEAEKLVVALKSPETADDEVGGMKKPLPEPENGESKVEAGFLAEDASADVPVSKYERLDDVKDQTEPETSEAEVAKSSAQEPQSPTLGTDVSQTARQNSDVENLQEAPGSKTQAVEANDLPQQEVAVRIEPSDAHLSGAAGVPDAGRLSGKDPPPEAEVEGETVSKFTSDVGYASSVTSGPEEEHFSEQFVSFIKRKDPPPEAELEGEAGTESEERTPERMLRRKDPPPEAEFEVPSPDSVEVLESNIAKLRQKFDELSAVAMKGTVIEQFLTSTGHQLTYYGLHELHRHLAEECLCVFFRNNHFATMTKHRDVLYLLVTDLGYANIEEVMWEKLDAIDGDTEYANADFVKPPPRETLQIEQPSGLRPEDLQSQDGATAADRQLALQLSGASHAKSQAEIDEDEGRLVAAAMEDSLRELQLVEEGADGAFGKSEEGEKKPSARLPAASGYAADEEAVLTMLEREEAEVRAQEEADAAMAMALQEEERNMAKEQPSTQSSDPATPTGNGEKRSAPGGGRPPRANPSPSQPVGVGRAPPFGRPLAAGGTDANKEKCVIS